MYSEFPLTPIELKKFNIRKYRGVQPSWELVQKCIDKSGLKTQIRFEMVWGIPEKILTQYKNGDKGLPCRYWHIFYEFDNLLKESKKPKPAKTVHVKQNVKVLPTNQNIINELRQRHNANG